ncbi:hypothetical protein Cni_G26209 [Canna indica]|uniref:Large ribosomal subunit protein uL2 C-terminal domain-containing protein n=1 Tax=Canna indica TaxID=4628 RepID=A0AAQ3L5N4_9LILI|nr:hypothetical protein Cni_G26209 [Canna indica]
MGRDKDTASGLHAACRFTRDPPCVLAVDNPEWIQKRNASCAEYLTPGCSDHAPIFVLFQLSALDQSQKSQGAKLALAAGTYAKIMLEPASQCLVQLPSGVEKLIDSRCRATIGIVSNPNHGACKLRKAGQSRWLGRRPIVRGVAMNPVDHPHGGGEGRTKGGRPSVSPWGKPTKAGFWAVVGVGKRII